MSDWINNRFVVEAFCELLNKRKIMIIETKYSHTIVDLENPQQK